MNIEDMDVYKLAHNLTLKDIFKELHEMSQRVLQMLEKLNIALK